MRWNLFYGKQAESGEWSGFLEHGVQLEGKLEAPGTFRVDCRLRGNLSCEETVIVGEHGLVDGEVKGNAVVVGGRLDGVIHGRGRVEIQARGIVTGDIHTPCLIIESGASFAGRCHITDPKEASKEITVSIRSPLEATQT